MAGSRKGKNKQKKELKSGTSNTKSDVEHQNEAAGTDKLCDPTLEEEQKVEKQLYLKIESAYKQACLNLSDMGYKIETIKEALLRGGYIFGNGDILSSIMKNTLTIIKNATKEDGKVVFNPEQESVFKTLPGLIQYWIQNFVNLAESRIPGVPKSQAFQMVLNSRIMAFKTNIPGIDNEGLSSSEVKSRNDQILFSFDQKMHQNSGRVRAFTSPLIMKKARDDHRLVKNNSGGSTSSDGREKKGEMVTNLEELIEKLEKRIEERKKLAIKKRKELANAAKSEVSQSTNEGSVASSLGKGKKKQLAKVKRRKEQLEEEMRKCEAEKERIQAGIESIQLMDEYGTMKDLEKGLKKVKEDLLKKEDLTGKHDIGKEHEEEGLVDDQEKGNGLLLEEEELENVIIQAQQDFKLPSQQELEEVEQFHIPSFEELQLTESDEEDTAGIEMSLPFDDEEFERRCVMCIRERLMLETAHLRMHLFPLSGESEARCSSSQQSSAQQKHVHAYRRCVVCCRNEINVIFMPCSDLIVCYDCCLLVGDFCPACGLRIGAKFIITNVFPSN